MKICVYDILDYEEPILERLQSQIGEELVRVRAPLTESSLALAKGCCGLSILGYSRVDRPLLEAMAQVGAIAILSLPENKGKLALFGGVKHARFKRQVVPGDVLEMECVLTKRRGLVGIGECKALVNGEVACTAELIFAVQAG